MPPSIPSQMSSPPWDHHVEGGPPGVGVGVCVCVTQVVALPWVTRSVAPVDTRSGSAVGGSALGDPSWVASPWVTQGTRV